MRLRRRLRAYLAAGLLASGPALAATVTRFPESDWGAKHLQILSQGPTLLDASMEFEPPPPPAADSAETAQELRYLRRISDEPMPAEEYALMIEEAAPGEFTERFMDTAGLSDELKTCAGSLLAMADRDLQYFVLHYKRRFARARPTQLDPELKIRVEVPAHASYPSGHATQGRMSSLLVAHLIESSDPEQATAVLAFGRGVGRRREWGGVHYPSDTETGWLLAERVLAALMSNPTFSEAFEEASACLKAD